MQDEELTKLVNGIGPGEGMKVVCDPGILSPEEFVKEVIEQRLPNKFIPDTPQRIACDTSQKVGIRYGETIKSYVEKYGSANSLKYVPVSFSAGGATYPADGLNCDELCKSADVALYQVKEAGKGKFYWYQ